MSRKEEPITPSGSDLKREEEEEKDADDEPHTGIEIKKVKLEMDHLKEMVQKYQQEMKQSKEEIVQLRADLAQETANRIESDQCVSDLRKTVEHVTEQFHYFCAYYNSYYGGQNETELHQNTTISKPAEQNTGAEGNQDNADSITGSPSVASNSKGDEADEIHATGDGEGVDSGKISADLEKAAEEAMTNNGMVYDENSGMYYDWNSHMYYDPTTHLYYDNDNGIYYYYDSERNGFIFYSQVPVAQSPSSNEGKTEKKGDSHSEGEVTSESEVDTDDEDQSKGTQPVDLPCVRAIVKTSDGLTPGTLFVVTINGASIGRDKRHIIRLPGILVSKDHAVITFDKDKNTYFLHDVGSVNGTYLDGVRLSESKIRSQDYPLTHCSELKIGETVLLLHVHKGTETCDSCEPGQVQAFLAKHAKTLINKNPDMSMNEVRQLQVKNLKKKYQLAGNGLNKALAPIIAGKYKDRANIRRQQVGSEPMVNSNENKLGQREQASIHEEIPEENIGHKLLSKMGWKAGEGLGKTNQGIINPVEVTVRDKKAGLGRKITKALTTRMAKRNRIDGRKHKKDMMIF